MINNKKWGGLLIAIVLLIVSVWLVNTLLAQRGAQLQHSLKASTPVVIGKVGEPLMSGNVQTTVEKFQIAPEIEGFVNEHKSSGWGFIIVTLHIENKGNENLTFNFGSFDVSTTQENFHYDLDIGATNFLTKKNYYDQKKEEIILLSPNQKLELTIAYYVNQNEKKLLLDIPVEDFEGQSANTKKQILLLER